MPYEHVSPVVTETPTGWQAVSPPGEHPRIGVAAESADRAREAFVEELARWSELRDTPDPRAYVS